jgi:hypothetical protein
MTGCLAAGVLVRPRGRPGSAFEGFGALARVPASRWREENFLKYASENYGIDKICDYIAAIETNTKIIGNPARKTASAAVRHAEKALAAAREDMAVMLASPAIPAAAKNGRLIPAAGKTITRAERALAHSQGRPGQDPRETPRQRRRP